MHTSVKGTKYRSGSGRVALVGLELYLFESFGNCTAGMVLLPRDLPDALVFEIIGSPYGFSVFHSNYLRSLLSLAGTITSLTIAEKRATWLPFDDQNYTTWLQS